jgi:hypothetical protein
LFGLVIIVSRGSGNHHIQMAHIEENLFEPLNFLQRGP